MSERESMFPRRDRVSVASPQPRRGDTWRSLDPRDDGLTATVTDVSDEYVWIMRFRKSRVRIDRFFREYAFVRSA